MAPRRPLATRSLPCVVVYNESRRDVTLNPGDPGDPVMLQRWVRGTEKVNE